MKLRIILLVCSLLLLIFMGIAGYVGWQLSQPMSATSQPMTRFVIPKGQASSIIATQLQEKGYIKNAFAFRWKLKQLGLENKLQAGSFELSPSMTLQEIATTLTSGTNDIWITLLEGWRREEVAEYLSTQDDLSVFDSAEFLNQTASLEGRLFPDTYFIPKQSTAEDVVALLQKTFENKVVEGLADELGDDRRTLPEILVMASLVQREAQRYEDMRLVAAVLQRRIEIGMPLQVDATLQYVKGYDQKTKSWWTPPLASDKQLASAFNTYSRGGLPPSPIANPGLDAIKAVLNPAKTDALFYIHAPDGKMYTAKTLEEHNRNVQRYLR